MRFLASSAIGSNSRFFIFISFYCPDNGRRFPASLFQSQLDQPKISQIEDSDLLILPPEPFGLLKIGEDSDAVVVILTVILVHPTADLPIVPQRMVDYSLQPLDTEYVMLSYW